MGGDWIIDSGSSGYSKDLEMFLIISFNDKIIFWCLKRVCNCLGVFSILKIFFWSGELVVIFFFL